MPIKFLVLRGGGIWAERPERPERRRGGSARCIFIGPKQKIGVNTI